MPAEQEKAEEWGKRGGDTLFVIEGGKAAAEEASDSGEAVDLLNSEPPGSMLRREKDKEQADGGQ